MKKLFGRAAGGTPAPVKKDGAGPLTNKTVQVGPHTVLVEHVLGLGGYGEIYRAVDISSGQRFALKVCWEDWWRAGSGSNSRSSCSSSSSA
jgi:hypothetical protein